MRLLKKPFSLMVCITLLLSVFMTGCNEEKKEKQVVTYDKEYEADVIVVGAGGAGLAAGIAVKENGGSVIILEKLNFTGGALNTTSGTISGAKTKIQEEDGLTEDTIESYAEDIFKEGKYQGDEKLIRVYAENAGKTVDWLVENGLEINVDQATGKRAIIAPEHTPYSYPRTYRPIAPEGYKSGVHAVLDNLVEDLGVEIHFETEAIEILTDENKDVVGVVALDREGNKIKYTANNGVIMSTGGYAANPKLMGYYNDHAKNYITGGLSSANGYGIYMMQRAGAMINEDAMGWIPSYPMGLETRPGQGIIMHTKTQFFGGILVNIDGNRFVNEVAGNVEREEALAEQPKGTQWEVYNQEIMDRMMEEDVHRFYNAMLGMIMDRFDNLVVRGDTLEELAENMNIPVESFIETVENYNQYIKDGEDKEFNRSFEADFGNPRTFAQHVNTLENGPYYAVPIKPISLFTMGGVKTNEYFQVLDTSSQAIPGLYAVGETVGGLWGEFPSGGTGVAGAVTTGRLAGENIMKLEKVSRDTRLEKIEQKQIKEELFEVEEVELEIEEDENIEYKDGEYEGEGNGYNGLIKVLVKVEDGKISLIEILDENETETIAKDTLENTPLNMVENNSVNVDNVAGATVTTDGIREAVRNALEKAK